MANLLESIGPQLRRNRGELIVRSLQCNERELIRT